MTELKAPTKKFRVVGVDTFDGTDWIDKDVVKLQTAKAIADSRVIGQQMIKYYVYNDEGKCVYSGGTF